MDRLLLILPATSLRYAHKTTLYSIIITITTIVGIEKFNIRCLVFRLQLLRLLTKSSETSETITDAPIVQIKMEVPDTDDAASDHLDEKVLEKVAKILDQNRSWEKLAKHLDCDYLLSTMDAQQSSPSMIILNYADVSSLSSLFYESSTSDLFLLESSCLHRI